jgi:hypothetical protein
LSPRESNRWLEQEMMPYYTLGVKKSPEDTEGVTDGGN